MVTWCTSRTTPWCSWSRVWPGRLWRPLACRATGQMPHGRGSASGTCRRWRPMCSNRSGWGDKRGRGWCPAWSRPLCTGSCRPWSSFVSAWSASTLLAYGRRTYIASTSWRASFISVSLLRPMCTASRCHVRRSRVRAPTAESLSPGDNAWRSSTIFVTSVRDVSSVWYIQKLFSNWEFTLKSYSSRQLAYWDRPPMLHQ